jgi:hypothetical protein
MGKAVRSDQRIYYNNNSYLSTSFSSLAIGNRLEFSHKEILKRIGRYNLELALIPPLFE